MSIEPILRTQDNVDLFPERIDAISYVYGTDPVQYITEITDAIDTMRREGFVLVRVQPLASTANYSGSFLLHWRETGLTRVNE